MHDAALRPIMFQIDYGWIIYILAVLSVIYLIFAFYRRSRLWPVERPVWLISPFNDFHSSYIFLICGHYCLLNLFSAGDWDP